MSERMKSLKGTTLAERIVTLVCNELEARGVEIKEVGIGCKSEEEIAILVQYELTQAAKEG